MSFVAQFLDKFGTTRKGFGQCDCGTIKYEVTVPYSSYCFVDHISTICHCRDCVTKIPSLSNGGQKLVEEYDGVHLLPFYLSDVKLLTDNNNDSSSLLGKVRLNEKSSNVRSYCKKCLTPVAMDERPFPITWLFVKHLQPSTYPITACPKPAVMNYGSCTKKAKMDGYWTALDIRGPGILTNISFVIRVLSFVFWGFIFGKGNGGLHNGKYDDDTTIGLESLIKKKKDT